MRCEGVSQAMWVRSDPAQRARVQPSATRRHEEGILGSAHELRTRIAEVTREPPGRLLAQRDDPLLAALAAHADVLLLEVDIPEVEADGLRAPKTGGVHELHERAVSKCERAVAVQRFDQPFDLLASRRVRQPSTPARRDGGFRHSRCSEREAEERADGSKLARHRRRREAARAPSCPRSPEVGRVLDQRARIDGLEAMSAPAQPGGELLDIDAVRPPSSVAEHRGVEKTLHLLSGVHPSRFALALRSPAVPSQDTIDRYADLIVEFAANVQPGQIVGLAGDWGTEEGMRAVAASAYRRGAKFVDPSYFDPYVKRARLLHAVEDTLEFVPSWYGAKMLALGDERAARITLFSPDPQAFADVDPARAGKDMLPALKESHEMIGKRFNNWTAAMWPTPSWARLVHPDVDDHAGVERLWEDLVHMCRLDESDPLAAWRSRMDTLEAVAARLTERRFDSLHFEGPGTDLTIGLLPSSRWWTARFETIDGLPHQANLPSEETFTSPDPERVEGIVASTKPLLLAGAGAVRDLVIRFEGGRAVQIDAREGADALRSRTQKDEGAARLGEVALVDAEGRIGKLGKVFQHTLIDENAASHIALGNGFPFAVDNEADRSRINDSAIHVDFMIGSEEVSVTGVTNDAERVPVLSGGAWQI